MLRRILYYPISGFSFLTGKKAMASIVSKKKGNQIYYYVVTSGRVDGKPRITHQTYLGTAERLAQLVRDKAAPFPLEATARDCGITRLLDGAGLPRESVTLVMDKGSAALANTLELQDSRLGWIAALPWDQASGPSARSCTATSTWGWCATRRASRPSSSRASARRWRKRPRSCAP